LYDCLVPLSTGTLLGFSFVDPKEIAVKPNLFCLHLEGYRALGLVEVLVYDMHIFVDVRTMLLPVTDPSDVGIDGTFARRHQL